MGEKQRQVTPFDEFFGKTPDEEFFQKMTGMDPEDNKIGALALGTEKIVKDFLYGRFTGGMRDSTESVSPQEELRVAEEKVGLFLRNSGRDENDLRLEGGGERHEIVEGTRGGGGPVEGDKDTFDS